MILRPNRKSIDIYKQNLLDVAYRTITNNSSASEYKIRIIEAGKHCGISTSISDKNFKTMCEAVKQLLKTGKPITICLV